VGSATLSDDVIRRLLDRRDLAAARHRSAIGRRLGLGETEMLAVAHLAQHGELTPTRLGELLDLSSGGASALVQRLEAAGDVVRRAHPTDGRRSLVRLSAPLVRRAERAFAPLAAEIAKAPLDDREREIVVRFLADVAEATERQADAARSRHRPAPAWAPQVPSRWG
jgi:DNA-binding MarR family transcriptional regulator